jgi:hypothetical protein
MNHIDFKAQADDVIANLIAKNRLDDAVFARKQNDFGGLSYYIARALGLDFQATVKFGLIWAVADAIDALEAV